MQHTSKFEIGGYIALIAVMEQSRRRTERVRKVRYIPQLGTPDYWQPRWKWMFPELNFSKNAALARHLTVTIFYAANVKWHGESPIFHALTKNVSMDDTETGALVHIVEGLIAEPSLVKTAIVSERLYQYVNDLIEHSSAINSKNAREEIDLTRIADGC